MPTRDRNSAAIKLTFAAASFLICLCLTGFAAAPEASSPLKLVRTVKLPATAEGKFDHFGVDVRGSRLFLAAENSKEILVLDLNSGKLLRTIHGVVVPHAIAYRESSNRIYVTDGGAGDLKVFDGKTYRLLKSIKLRADADSMAYDQTMRYLYIVNGGSDAHESYSFVSVIDTSTDSKVGEIRIGSPRLEALAVETSSEKLYVNNTGSNQIDVINRDKYTFMTSWPITLCKQNVPLAIDQANHRLFVGCRSGKIAVVDTSTGKELQGLTIGTGVDDLVFDPQSKLLFASCGGDGAVYIYRQKSADNYESLGHAASGAGARNSRYVAELHQYYVAVPAHSGAPAEVLIYQVR
ncbi:MAG TPA: YncE family protein [Candidatus Acidoferrales bacterium]|nr:YncE family protein [Candidatus Acidoferrales bacterium]